uniref:Uncharacterized protein n=1 Tax=Erpetoichthys calabaricus TaxID=27687 RepID=A0A8C4SF22_ERPCA
MAKYHSLCNSDGAIYVAKGLEFLFFAVTKNVVLLDCIQSLFFSRKKQHLANVPLNSNALVLVTLGCNHDICFIQYKDSNFLWFNKFQLGTPVKYCIPTFVSSDCICKFHLWVKLPHLNTKALCKKNTHTHLKRDKDYTTLKTELIQNCTLF